VWQCSVWQCSSVVSHVEVTYGVPMLFLQWVMERGGSGRRKKDRQRPLVPFKMNFKCMFLVCLHDNYCSVFRLSFQNYSNEKVHNEIVITK